MDKKANDWTILAFDPGKLNFAWCRLSFNSLESGHFEHTLTSFKETNDFNKTTRKFHKTVKKMTKGADFVIFERFMWRRRGGRGNVQELSNVMIGIVVGSAPKDTILLPLTAAQWKNYFNSKLELNNLKFKNKSPHERDAICMALYAAIKNKLLHRHRAKIFIKLLESGKRF